MRARSWALRRASTWCAWANSHFSPLFRDYIRKITRALAEHYADNPHVLGWQTESRPSTTGATSPWIWISFPTTAILSLIKIPRTAGSATPTTWITYAPSPVISWCPNSKPDRAGKRIVSTIPPNPGKCGAWPRLPLPTAPTDCCFSGGAPAAWARKSIGANGGDPADASPDCGSSSVSHWKRQRIRRTASPFAKFPSPQKIRRTAKHPQGKKSSHFSPHSRPPRRDQRVDNFDCHLLKKSAVSGFKIPCLISF